MQVPAAALAAVFSILLVLGDDFSFFAFFEIANVVVKGPKNLVVWLALELLKTLVRNALKIS